MHQSINPMRQMKYSEYLASIFGACFIDFALGIWLAGAIGWLATPAFVLGLAVHGWGMYKVQNRNS
jgi:UPF0716 family protein affecting phage T7 exclusion